MGARSDSRAAVRDLHRGEGDPAGRRQPEGPRPVRGRGRRGAGGGRGLAVGGRRESDGAALRGAGRAVRACSFVRMGAIPGRSSSRATGSSRPSRASTGTGATSIPGSDPTSRRRPEAGEGREDLRHACRRRPALDDPRGLRRSKPKARCDPSRDRRAELPYPGPHRRRSARGGPGGLHRLHAERRAREPPRAARCQACLGRRVSGRR